MSTCRIGQPVSSAGGPTGGPVRPSSWLRPTATSAPQRSATQLLGAPGQHVQLRRHVPVRRPAGDRGFELPQRLDRPRLALQHRARHQVGHHADPVHRLDAAARPRRPARRARSRRTGAASGRPAPTGRPGRWPAGSRRPAGHRALGPAPPPAARPPARSRTPPGRSAPATAASVSAGESTTSSRPWQSTRSYEPGLTAAGSRSTSPCSGVTRRPHRPPRPAGAAWPGRPR